MEQGEQKIFNEMRESLFQIKQYLEKEISTLNKELNSKDNEIRNIKKESENARYVNEGNKQLINKLLGDLSKLHNDIEWYKKTYEQRTLLGTIREKLFRKRDV